MTGERDTVWLPDDLEERWAAMTPTERRAAYAMYLQRQAEGRLGWRERRRLRRLLTDGEPLTQSLGAELHAASLAEADEDAARKRRLRKEYGDDGLRAIDGLVNGLWMKRPGVPTDRAYAWAERVYRCEPPPAV